MNNNEDIEFNPSILPFYEIAEFNGSAAKLDFFNFVVEIVSDQIFLMHKDSQILYVNESACKSLGYTQDELLGKFVWEWDPNINEEMWPGLWAETKEKKHIHLQTEHRTKSGEFIPVDIHAYYYERAGEQFSVAVCKRISKAKS
jgi:PAS domain S-box-containing protein